MADDLDAMLQADDPAASQAQTDQGTDTTQSTQTVVQQSPEEVEFNSLSGNAQARFKKAYSLLQEKERKIAELEAKSYVPPAPNLQTPGTQDALRTLANLGVATDEKVDTKINNSFNQLRWELEMQKLESSYDGSKGEPQFVREEVETFIQQHPQYSGYSAEDVYRYKMFPEEFKNLDLQKGSPKTGQSTTLRPTKAAMGEETMSPEYIAERTDVNKYPDAKEWYNENIDKINEVLSRMTPPQQ